MSLLQPPPAHWTMNRQYRLPLVNKHVKREAVTLTQGKKEKVKVKQRGLAKKQVTNICQPCSGLPWVHFSVEAFLSPIMCRLIYRRCKDTYGGINKYRPEKNMQINKSYMTISIHCMVMACCHPTLLSLLYCCSSLTTPPQCSIYTTVVMVYFLEQFLTLMQVRDNFHACHQKVIETVAYHFERGVARVVQHIDLVVLAHTKKRNYLHNIFLCISLCLSPDGLYIWVCDDKDLLFCWLVFL